MRYEDMPKGRNKDRCVRCGKRYNFADKALSKAKVPYDLLCLAEVTTSGYMTHGNVKLCDECMVELLMWLDRKTEPTISKMEQVDKDINVRSKDEPQHDIDKGTIGCDNCAENGSYKCSKCDGEIYFKRLAVKDEPQDECAKEYEELGLRKLKELRKDEPQTERSE